jgi:hypothetical protein
VVAAVTVEQESSMNYCLSKYSRNIDCLNKLI